MKGKANFLGHPVHPMLIVFPLAFFPVSVGLDAAYLFGGWARGAELAFWLISFGIVGGVVAAVFGLLDWLAIPSGTRAKRIGLIHGTTNIAVVLLFAVSWYLRYSNPPANPPFTAMVVSLVALIGALAAAWLGGELVDRLGVGVDTNANVNAPSSITHPHIEGPSYAERYGRHAGART